MTTTRKDGWYVNVRCPGCKSRCSRTNYIDCECGATMEYDSFVPDSEDSPALAYSQQQSYRKQIEQETNTKFDPETKTYEPVVGN